MLNRILSKQIKDYLKTFSRPKNLIFCPKLVDKPTGDNILVLSPHFDDDVIGCSGTLHKHILAGDKVTIVYLTDGREGDPSFEDKDLLEQIRKQEAISATKILGIENLIFLDQPETKLKSNKDLLHRLAGIFNQIKPDLVYLPWFLDNHIDHFELNRIFLDLCQHIPLNFNICAYELWTPLIPNIVVDIGDVLSKKEEALKQYQTQIKQVDYLNTTLALNKYRSATNLQGRTYVEAFLDLSVKDYINLMKRSR
ncbi:MAG: PIG-L family deacetylase [Nitrospirota bacterium]